MSPSASQSTSTLQIEHDAPIPTWFHVGGGAKRLVRAQTPEDLLACLELDDELLILGDGANLLVDDHGVSNLVVSLETDGFRSIEFDQTTGVVIAGAGVSLPSLINQCVKRGLGGLEMLAGIPASVGGAAIMNAGGALGSMSDVISHVHAIDRAGRMHCFDRSQIDFGYRQSRLNHLIVTQVVFELSLTPKEELLASRDRCMAYKCESQPLGDQSAGCVFKNPVLEHQIEGVGEQGERVSAGMLIDRVGLKGLRCGQAQVSPCHANFVTTAKGGRADDIIELIGQVQLRVFDALGVQLDRELVIWSDDQSKAAENTR